MCESNRAFLCAIVILLVAGRAPLRGYPSEELLDFKELEQALVPLSFCEEEELGHKEELCVFPYMATRLH